MREFMQGLQRTRLQKLARLHTGVTPRENIAKIFQQEGLFTFNLKTFNAKEQAIF